MDAAEKRSLPPKVHFVVLPPPVSKERQTQTGGKKKKEGSMDHWDAKHLSKNGMKIADPNHPNRIS